MQPAGLRGQHRHSHWVTRALPAGNETQGRRGCPRGQGAPPPRARLAARRGSHVLRPPRPRSPPGAERRDAWRGRQGEVSHRPRRARSVRSLRHGAAGLQLTGQSRAQARGPSARTPRVGQARCCPGAPAPPCCALGTPACVRTPVPTWYPTQAPACAPPRPHLAPTSPDPSPFPPPAPRPSLRLHLLAGSCGLGVRARAGRGRPRASQ